MSTCKICGNHFRNYKTQSEICPTCEKIQNNSYYKCAQEVVPNLINSQLCAKGVKVEYNALKSVLSDYPTELRPSVINKICALQKGWDYIFHTMYKKCNFDYVKKLYCITNMLDYYEFDKFNSQKSQFDNLGFEGATSVADVLGAGVDLMINPMFNHDNIDLGIFLINKMLIENKLGICIIESKNIDVFRNMLFDCLRGKQNPDMLCHWILLNGVVTL